MKMGMGCLVLLATIWAGRSEGGLIRENSAVTRPAVGPGLTVDEKEGWVLNFREAKIGDVLNEFAKAGSILVYDDGVEEQLELRMNLISRLPIPRSDAIKIFNAVASYKGIIALPKGDRILWIKSRQRGVVDNMGTVPVLIGIDALDIPNTDDLITQIMPLKYLDVTMFSESIKTNLSPDATVTTNVGSNSLVVTDKAKNIRKLADVLMKLDKQPVELKE